MKLFTARSFCPGDFIPIINSDLFSDTLNCNTFPRNSHWIITEIYNTKDTNSCALNTVSQTIYIFGFKYLRNNETRKF